jgi:hypothetical protein
MDQVPLSLDGSVVMNWIKHHKALTVLIGFVLLIALGGIANAVSPPKPVTPAAAAAASSSSSSSSPTPTNSPTPTPTRTIAQPVTYSSVQDVINALNRGGLPCTRGTSGTPVVKGATSETLCNFDSSSQALIDVFPRTHLVSSAEVLTNSVSTGTQQIWTVYRSNWWVQTDTTYDQRVQGILGGKILAGPWHPQAKSTPSAAPRLTHSAAPPPAPTSAATPPRAPTSAAAPPPASCSPLTNGGNCYEPGEYCRTSDRGASGVAGDGEKITCEDNNGWRWEPVG